MKLKRLIYNFARLSAEGRFVTLRILFVSIVLFGLGCWAIQFFVFGEVSPQRIVELLLDPGAFVDSDTEKLPVLFQLFITVFGVIFFTAILINVVGNLFDSMINDYRKGLERPPFREHTLILGANSMLYNILRTFEECDNAKSQIVVVTAADAEELRTRLQTSFTKALMERVSILHGQRDEESSLKDLSVTATRAIYLLGENDEPNHDAKSLCSLRLLQQMCSGLSSGRIECFVALNRASSSHILQYEQLTNSQSVLKIIYINAVESHAQRVLVSRNINSDAKSLCPAIYRNGVKANDECGVHLVVVGMTQIACAMATTAAHICHFPNFVTNGVRTKISFVMPNIKQEMEFFIGHYASLFALSHYKFISWDKSGERCEQAVKPNEAYGDFLDVEWEFVDGGLESKEVREWLSACAEADSTSEYLSIAICNDDAAANVAAALYLPSVIYDKNIPLFVYQPTNDEVLGRAHETSRYSNIYPFGMRNDCYDPTFKNRLRVAKRVNGLYAENFGIEGDVEQLWDELVFAKRQSNLWSANSVAVKLSSLTTSIEEEGALMSHVEHNRWNIEKLLLGFQPLTLEERSEYHALSKIDKDSLTELQRERMAEFKERKERNLCHYDIAHYDELSPATQAVDRYIVDHLLLLAKEL